MDDVSNPTTEGKRLPTPEDVEKALRQRRLPENRLGIKTWCGLAMRVARHVGVRLADICGRDRTKSIAHARHLVWAALRTAGYSLPEIAAPWGADHTTVMSAVKKIERSKSTMPPALLLAEAS